jgi:hypothetical protein
MERKNDTKRFLKEFGLIVKSVWLKRVKFCHKGEKE